MSEVRHWISVCCKESTPTLGYIVFSKFYNKEIFYPCPFPAFEEISLKTMKIVTDYGIRTCAEARSAIIPKYIKSIPPEPSEITLDTKTSGWISPEGDFYETDDIMHEFTAHRICVKLGIATEDRNGTVHGDRLLYLGWLIIRSSSISKDSYTELTNRQIEKLLKFAECAKTQGYITLANSITKQVQHENCNTQ